MIRCIDAAKNSNLSRELHSFMDDLREIRSSYIIAEIIRDLMHTCTLRSVLYIYIYMYMYPL